MLVYAIWACILLGNGKIEFPIFEKEQLPLNYLFISHEFQIGHSLYQLLFRVIIQIVVYTQNCYVKRHQKRLSIIKRVLRNIRMYIHYASEPIIYQNILRRIPNYQRHLIRQAIQSLFQASQMSKNHLLSEMIGIQIYFRGRIGFRNQNYEAVL